MAVTPQLERARELFRTMVPEPAPTIADKRRGYERMLATLPIPAGARVDAEHVNGVPCLRVHAEGAKDGGLVVLVHGGGFVMGSAHGYRSFAAAVSSATGSAVLVVDYRLAPEHPHPAAVEDVAAVMRSVRSDAVSRVVLLGDSAGAGVAMGTLVALRDAGDVLPDATVLISPLVDLAATGASLDGDADPIVRRANILLHGAMYLAGRSPQESPTASPLYADLSDLPPTLVLVGGAEGLLADSIRLHERLVAAGSPAELTVAEDMIHVWPIFSSFLPEGASALAQVGAFVEAIHPRSKL